MNAETPDNVKLPVSGKLIAWFALVTGVLTVVSPVTSPHFLGVSLSTVQSSYYVALGTVSAFLGMCCVKGFPRAFYVLWYVFAIQLCDYSSEAYTFSFIGPFAIKIGFGNNDPPTLTNFNLVAIVGCFMALYNARYLRHQPISA
jgi:hypothetical protein